jgi:hypothetical protein
MKHYLPGLILVLLMAGCFLTEPSYELRDAMGDDILFRFEISDENIVFNFNPSAFSYRAGQLAFADPNLIAGHALVTMDSTAKYDQWFDTLAIDDQALVRFPSLYKLEDGRLSDRQALASGWHNGKFAVNKGRVFFARMAYEGQNDSLSRLEIYLQGADSQMVGKIKLDRPGTMAIKGDVIYIEDGDQLTIVDVQDVTQPRIVKSLPLRHITHFTVDGDKLVVSTTIDVRVFDIANPRNPILLATLT